MKKLLPYISLAMLGVFAASCQKDLDTYEGENGMYFDTQYKGAATLSDTIDVAWGMKNSSVTSQEIGLVVKLFGNTAPFDRSFDIVIEEAPTFVSKYKPSNGDDDDDDVDDDAATEPDSSDPDEPAVSTTIPTATAQPGEDYIISGTTFVIPAGEAEVTIPVTLMRRDDLHLAKRSFKVRLIENSNLKFLYSRAMPEYEEDGTLTWRPMDYQRVIRMDEAFPMPSWWYVLGEPYFGDFSQKKAMLICDVMNIDREQWIAGEVPVGRLRFCGQYMHNYLLENPQYEDDGTLMEMGYQSQI